jgi:hypothetical protein
MLFKRNQIEEAISRAIGERSAKPSSTLRTRLKRLLDVDRKLGDSSARFAFYAKTPGGKGAEISFSFADACALFIGMRMLEHGWPQNFVVSSLRHIRSDLTRRHEAILRRPVQQSAPPQTGAMAFPGSTSDFLLVVSDIRAPRKAPSEPYLRLFDDQVEAFAFQMKEVGRSCSWFSLEAPARVLHEQLLTSLPRRRGRGS